MSIVVAGLNHKSAPIALLERLAIARDELPKALVELSNRRHVLGGVIVSTCNRVEVYAAVTKFHGGAQDIRDFLAEFCHIAPEDFVDSMYTYHDEAAVRHLCRVGAGLDSMIVGESEILGQLRQAFSLARDEGVVQEDLERAFVSALRVGVRARAETALSRRPASIASAAVELARQTFGAEAAPLAGRRVLVIGAGKVGRLAADALRRAGVIDVVVVNRDGARAQMLARSLGVTAVPLTELPSALGSADVVLCSTSAPQPLIDRDMAQQAMSGRDSRRLLIVDISVPRNVDPEVAEVPGVLLRDIDALREVTSATTAARLEELPKVERIITEEVQRFARRQRVKETASGRATLVRRAESVRRQELERVQGLLARLPEQDRQSIEQLTKRLTAKLVHSKLEDLTERGVSGDDSRGEGTGGTVLDPDDDAS